MNDKIDKLKELIEKSDNIVFFGGAGVSTESNIPDFRSSSGLFSQKLNKNFTPEQLVSHSFYIRYPEEFFNFYKAKLIYPNQPCWFLITIFNTIKTIATNPNMIHIKISPIKHDTW